MSQKDHKNIKNCMKLWKLFKLWKQNLAKIVLLKEKSNLSKLQNKKLNRKPQNRLNEVEGRISGLEDKVDEMCSLVKKNC